MRKLPAFLFVFLFLACSALAQSADGWMRIQADDGSFSVEVPDSYKYFFSETGFSVSHSERDYEASDMSIYSSYRDKTLISLEVYTGGKEVFYGLLNGDKDELWRSGRDEELNGVTLKTLEFKDSAVHARAKYVRVGEKIVVLLVAARGGRTPVMDRFFESFELKAATSPVKTGKLLSSLVRSDITMQTTQPTPKKKAKKAPEDPAYKKMVLLRKFAPSYVDSARAGSIQGKIELRVRFEKSSFIPHIEVQKTLPNGLLRQTLYAVARTRFLPPERDEVPVDSTRAVIYTFGIR